MTQVGSFAVAGFGGAAGDFGARSGETRSIGDILGLGQFSRASAFDIPQYSFAQRNRHVRGQWVSRVREWLWADSIFDF